MNQCDYCHLQFPCDLVKIVIIDEESDEPSPQLCPMCELAWTRTVEFTLPSGFYNKPIRQAEFGMALRFLKTGSVKLRKVDDHDSGNK